MEKWAPEINKIYQPGGGVLDDMLEEMLQQTAELDVCEVYCYHVMFEVQELV